MVGAELAALFHTRLGEGEVLLFLKHKSVTISMASNVETPLIGRRNLERPVSASEIPKPYVVNCKPNAIVSTPMLTHTRKTFALWL